MAVKWNSETNIKFIQEFRSYESLWNTKSATYKNKQMRQASYKKIVEAMNIQGFGIPEAKNKMRNLRSTYYQEKKKIEKSKTSGSGSDDVYIPSLKWFTEMDALLKDVDERRRTIDNVGNDSQSIQDDTPGTQDESSQFSVIQKTDLSFNDNEPGVLTQESDRPIKKNVSNRKGIFRAIEELKKLQEMVNKDQPASNPNLENQEESQFDLFGKSVALQLKNLSYDRALTAQSKIQTVLSDLAIENYRYANVSRCTGISSSEISDIDSVMSTPMGDEDTLGAAISMSFGPESPILPTFQELQ